MSEGSDSEDADFSLPPERALQQLKALLQAERGLDHHARVVKKRKLSSHLSNSSTWPEARDNDQNAVRAPNFILGSFKIIPILHGFLWDVGRSLHCVLKLHMQMELYLGVKVLRLPDRHS